MYYNSHQPYDGLNTSNFYKSIKRNLGYLTDEDISASFQESVIEVLTTKLIIATKKEDLKRVVVTGGVAANKALRERVIIECKKHGLEASFPKPVYCTDNAAMIACAGYYKYRNNRPSFTNTLNLDASSMLRL